MSAGTLYTFVGSGNSYKVRLLEKLIGIELEHEELNFLADQQHSPEFLKINPRGELPTLVVGDKIFSDSSSILTWLAGSSNSSYWSKDLYEQAQIINWVGLNSLHIWVCYRLSSPSCRSPTLGFSMACSRTAPSSRTMVLTTALETTKSGHRKS